MPFLTLLSSGILIRTITKEQDFTNYCFKILCLTIFPFLLPICACISTFSTIWGFIYYCCIYMRQIDRWKCTTRTKNADTLIDLFFLNEDPHRLIALFRIKKHVICIPSIWILETIVRLHVNEVDRFYFFT